MGDRQRQLSMKPGLPSPSPLAASVFQAASRNVVQNPTQKFPMRHYDVPPCSEMSPVNHRCVILNLLWDKAAALHGTTKHLEPGLERAGTLVSMQPILPAGMSISVCLLSACVRTYL